MQSLSVSRTFRLRAAALLSLGAVVCCASSGAQQMTPEQRKAAHQPTIAYTPNKHIYPSVGDAPKDLAAALKQARREHKRIILDFGGDWCGDCQVLDIYFHQPPNDELMKKYFVKVNVNIGHGDENVAIAKKYGVPLTGFPALAVAEWNGKPLYGQGKEFSDMRYMDAQSVTDFLNKWKR